MWFSAASAHKQILFVHMLRIWFGLFVFVSRPPRIWFDLICLDSPRIWFDLICIRPVYLYLYVTLVGWESKVAWVQCGYTTHGGRRVPSWRPLYNHGGERLPGTAAHWKQLQCANENFNKKSIDSHYRFSDGNAFSAVFLEGSQSPRTAGKACGAIWWSYRFMYALQQHGGGKRTVLLVLKWTQWKYKEIN